MTKKNNSQERVKLIDKLSHSKLFKLILLILSISFLILYFMLHSKSTAINNDFVSNKNVMNQQINQIEYKLINEGIDGVDKYLNELFSDTKNNQLNYAVIRELPVNFDQSKNTDPFPGEIKYSYPKEIKNEYYHNRFGHEVKANNSRYFLETGVKTSSNTNYSKTFDVASKASILLCWLLLSVWSILSAYRIRSLNIYWVIFLLITSILGYLVFFIITKFSKKSQI